MLRPTLLVFFILLSTLGAQPVLAGKTKDYNGVECSFSSIDGHPAYGSWVSSAYGLIGVVPDSTTYCPIDQGASAGYSFDKLAYVIIYGRNISSPRLCRRAQSGSVACGTSTPITGGNWILYKPAGSRHDLPFLSVKIGTASALIKNYAVYWND